MPDDIITSRVRPFVKEGATLGYAKDLKERGLWPPRLHNRKDHNDNDKKPTATPFLIIPARAGDNGTRPLPNTQAFHSQSIWLEDNMGSIISTPAVGNEYIVKCRLINIGAFASYGGLAEFYLDKPGVFNALAGTSGSLPAFGRTGFSILPGRSIDIKCPNKWKPLTPDDLLVGVLVQVYDPFCDMFTSKFDARNDRHVGRHDYTSDFYVRDWTSSPSIHDLGGEPSSDPQFYIRSDVWNRRVNNPGAFVNDQPANQDPQAGTGAAGDNFIFARISRNDASTKETVKAHFLFAEFGTGSPYLDCTTTPDPSVTFMPGETSKIISQPWHLHPSSSIHLCIAVQIYSNADPYMFPGLLGYTPGMPVTDMMVINDNNKAQKNIKVWNGIPDEAGMHFAMIHNSATFIRDFELSVNASQETVRRFTNANIMVHGSDYSTPLKERSTLMIPQMLPGERRWITFSYDGFSIGEGENLSITFNEVVEGNVINGFAISIHAISERNSLTSCLQLQQAAFERMEGMEIKNAQKGIALCKRLLEGRSDAQKYIEALSQISQLLMLSINEMSVAFGGLKDTFGVTDNIRQLLSYKDVKIASKAIAAHQKMLNQLDAWLTTAIKSRGDEASILFTVRFQKEVYCREQSAGEYHFSDLIKATNDFISNYSLGKVSNSDYPGFVKSMVSYFQQSAQMSSSGMLKMRLKELLESLDKTAAGIQKTHLAFLNDLLRINGQKKHMCG